MNTEVGTYGLRLNGPDSDIPGLGPASCFWPTLRVDRLPRDPAASGETPGTILVSATQARLWIIHGDRIEMDRDPLVARMYTARPLSDDALIHPYLALPAAIANRWLGRHVLHGAAFLLDDRAWGVTADKGGGKSTTVAHLLSRGLTVLSDDLLMIEGETVYAGPRSIDLRDEAAGTYGGEALGFLGSRDRWRLRPPEAPGEAPLAGFVTLAWGDRLSLERLDARASLEHVSEHSFMGPTPEEAAATLTLASLPTWRLTRPRGLDGLTEGIDRLLEQLA